MTSNVVSLLKGHFRLMVCMEDLETTATSVWLTTVMIHSFLSYVVLDGYCCHTWKFINFFRGKNEPTDFRPVHTLMLFLNRRARSRWSH
jgi:hypothetical protein